MIKFAGNNRYGSVIVDLYTITYTSSNSKALTLILVDCIKLFVKDDVHRHIIVCINSI